MSHTANYNFFILDEKSFINYKTAVDFHKFVLLINLLKPEINV